MQIYNLKSVKLVRRSLRSNATPLERIMWRHLRNRQVNGVKFYRQCSVGCYVVAFYAPALKLAIEIDGGQHNEGGNIVKDEKRSTYLRQFGLSVMRFWNNEVRDNLSGVLDRISGTIKLLTPPSPPLKIRGGTKSYENK